MKYKKGDKFIFEIGEVTDFRLPYIIKGTNACLSEEVLDNHCTKLSVTAEEFKDAILKMWPLGCSALAEKFGEGNDTIGRVLKGFTVEEIMEKLSEDNKIKPGDIVETPHGRAVVYDVQDPPYCHESFYYCLHKDKSILFLEGKNIKKTGKHLDLEAFLQQIEK